jgi:hypothetical protein
MAQSMKKSINLLQEYEKENNFFYDNIILFRTDIITTRPFACDQHDMRLMHLSPENHYPDGCNYWCAISKRDNIVKHAESFFENLPVIFSKVEFVPQKVMRYQISHMLQFPYATDLGTNGLLR